MPIKGIDLCRAYHNDVLRPILASHIPHLGNAYAAALIGWGSDVLGHDDEFSRDHEWGPRCILFLPPGLAQERERVYATLDRHVPDEFMGYPTRFAPASQAPNVRIPAEGALAKAHIQVTTVEEYARSNLGIVYPTDDLAWLTIPEQKLLELTRGEVFHDGLGTLTTLRQYYEGYYPVDVWKYRLAYAWQAVGWDADLIGLCALRGDTLSALHAVGTTLHQIMCLIFLLNRRYGPTYPKWFHREFYRLPQLANELGPQVESCYCDPDLSGVELRCQAICQQMIRFQDDLGLVPKASMRSYPFSRTGFTLDTNYLAQQIGQTITGQLRGMPLYGAVDQWVSNPDLLLFAERLKPLASLYRCLPPAAWREGTSTNDME